MDRRKFLRISAGVAGISVAGCLGSGGSGGSEARDEATQGNTSSSDEKTFSLDHPAAIGMDNDPHIGASPSETDAVIIAFEDPSCPSCRRFEMNVFPQLKSDLIDTGKVAYFYRPYPVVRPWAQSACEAMFATHDRNNAAFWSLKDYYYEVQSEIDQSSVLSKTKSFLADNTDVDAGGVIEDVEAGEYSGEVEKVLQAGKEADAYLTPFFYPFKNGSLVVKMPGINSAKQFRNVLKM